MHNVSDKICYFKKAYHGFNDITVGTVIPFTIQQYLNIKRRVIPEVVISIFQWQMCFEHKPTNNIHVLMLPSIFFLPFQYKSSLIYMRQDKYFKK